MKSKKRTTRPPSTANATKAVPGAGSTGASILSGASSTRVLGGEISNSQRDQNRATIIINLGGSDPDISNPSSAVSKTSTEGSARNSADAGPSPASDQEHSSILEESSVATDSGFDSSDASSKIETPPTEEENPAEEETSNAIYKRLMYLKKHGFPLWIPQPNLRLSRSYRRRGVSIGDVGILTAEGGFDFLFNICLPAGHPSNPDELPEGFSRLDLKPADVCEFRAHASHTHIASPAVKMQKLITDPCEGVSRATFQCSDSDGALLIMPQGAHDEDLRNISRFKDYAFLHAESWYQYANGPCGREIGNAELHLVTGCDKATSWGIATYSNLQSKCSEDNVTQLNFNFSHEGPHSLCPTSAWDYKGAAEVKAGPEDDELMDIQEVHANSPLRNQCTFIRSLTLALGDDHWERLQLKMAASVEARASTRSPKNPFASVLGAISSLPGRIGSLRGHSRVGTSKSTDSMTLTAHPATYVIDMLLQKCPKAKVVAVHDSDWCSVIRDSDDDWIATSQVLHHRIQEVFNIIEESGNVYLQERTTQPPNTLSRVSVKLDGFSQHFDSFEISHSDVGADSLPQSPVNDGDDATQSNLFHVLGEANLESMKEFFPRNTKLNLRYPSDDEDYLMPNAALPRPTSQIHEQRSGNKYDTTFDNPTTSSRTGILSIWETFTPVDTNDPLNDDDLNTLRTSMTSCTTDCTLVDPVPSPGIEYWPKRQLSVALFDEPDNNRPTETDSRTLLASMHVGDTQRMTVASEAHITASGARRKNPARLCNQTSPTKTNLQGHLNAHSDYKRHPCPHCGRAFSTQSSLRRHFKACKALQAKSSSEPIQQPNQESL